MRSCFACGADPAPLGAVGRRDLCPACGADVRCCRNCRFHDPQAYNECREPQAEHVVDKARANFCDFFSLGSGGEPARAESAAPSARDRLDALFRKKP